MERAESRARLRTTGFLTLLSAGLVGGVYVVVWASAQGFDPDVAVSVYHVPAYLSLAILLVWTVLATSRAVRQRAAGRNAWPLSDRPLLVGLGAIVGYIVLDVVWREVAPIRQGIEAAVAPTRLLLAVGLALVAAAPVRAAWRRGALGSAFDRLLVVVSAGLVAAALGFAILPLHPAATWWLYPPVDSREDDSEIWVMQADGGRQTRLLRGGNDLEYSLPSWSPDGRQLAGTGWELGAASGPAGFLWVAAADGSSYRRITNAPGWQWIPSWSRDGQWIAYTASPAGSTAASATRPAAPEPGRAPDVQAPASQGEDVWAVRPDGSGARLLIGGPGDDSAAVWSPDGQRLAFISGRDGNGELYIAAADGTAQRRLTDHPAEDWSPAWSPDGRDIAFTSDRSGDQDVWAVSADGSNLRQLTEDRASDTVPVWSPDGRRIAFVSDRTGDVEVWSMAPDGTDLRNLTDSPSSNDGQWAVAWSPDGTAIAYASAGLEPATELPAIREDLAVAGTVLNAILVGGVAILLASLGTFIGATAIVLAIDYGLASLVGGDWRMAAVAIVLGGLIDLVMRALPGRYRLPAAGALTAGGFVAVPVVVLTATGSLYWTPTLALGVVLLAGLVGWALGRVAAAARSGPQTHRQVEMDSP